MIPTLTSLLHKISRALKIQTLSTLISISSKYPAIIKKTAALILEESTPLITDDDLQLAQLSLQLINSQIGASPMAGLENIAQCGIKLATSPLIQGLALDELLNFFRGIGPLHKGSLTLTNLTKKLWAIAGPTSLKAIAKCIAALVLVSQNSQIDASIKSYIKTFSKVSEQENSRKLAALTLGEIGKQKDLKNYRDLLTTITNIFSSDSDEFKSYASICLGNISLGNLTYFLPVVLEQIKTMKLHHYLLLIALREIISIDPESLGPYLKDILPLMTEHAYSEEETIRNLVAENLGKLFIAHAMDVMEYFEKNLTSTNVLIRSTFATSFKYSGVKTMNRTRMGYILPTFFLVLKDKNVGVKTNALISLNTIAHNLPQLLRSEIDELMPIVLKETITRPELIKEVDLGPFKHKIDEGAPLRKSSYNVIDTLLIEIGERIDCTQVIERLYEGLGIYFKL